MSGTASGVSLDRLFDVLDLFAHPSTLSLASSTNSQLLSGCVLTLGNARTLRTLAVSVRALRHFNFDSF
jgi:hypothetical protein